MSVLEHTQKHRQAVCTTRNWRCGDSTRSFYSTGSKGWKERRKNNLKKTSHLKAIKLWNHLPKLSSTIPLSPIISQSCNPLVKFKIAFHTDPPKRPLQTHAMGLPDGLDRAEEHGAHTLQFGRLTFGFSRLRIFQSHLEVCWREMALLLPGWCDWPSESCPLLSWTECD